MKAVKVEPVCCEERILKHCHQTYTDTDNGLIAIAQSVGKTLPPPRRGITKHFSLVTFVDTPGLVDGDMKYPFDVDQAILQLGDVCDLILVFFDPMGQALCRRTLNIVEQLYERQGDRLRFYLSKADEAGGESDRQELHKRPGLNKCAIEMPSIYIPNPNKPSQCVNQIEEVCHTIHKTIKQVVQNTQNTLQKDCDLICEAVTDTLNSDWQCCKEKKKALRLSYALGLLGFSILLLFMLTLGILYRDLLELALGIYGAETLLLYLELTPGFGVLPPPPPAPPLPPPAPGAETVKSRKPVQTKMQPQLNCQTPSEVKGTVYNKLDDEHLLMMPQKDMISEKNLTTPLKKKDTTPPKYPTMPKVPQNDLITELKKRQLKRQATE
ncbi:hypothetical protein KOW79_001369 [Hemibagrus wyckioides]|uniref:Uncharacterized protein n=1 Tax=Hemibagrus wyckioides TaxID=337641 RepID=A0A9D3SXJ7_9TELE|nr:hypothetical protein KOW79_001369 [Hemibagrus wyckioides]